MKKLKRFIFKLKMAFLYVATSRYQYVFDDVEVDDVEVDDTSDD